MSLKGTRTAENLLKAYAGEMQANGRYNQYASIARKEGYVQIEKYLQKQHVKNSTRKIILQILKCRIKG